MPRPPSCSTDDFYLGMEKLGAASLQAGFDEEADAILAAGHAVHTTSSEALGEIGLVLRAIERSDRQYAPSLHSDLVATLATVRRVWPEI